LHPRRIASTARGADGMSRPCAAPFTPRHESARGFSRCPNDFTPAVTDRRVEHSVATFSHAANWSSSARRRTASSAPSTNAPVNCYGKRVRSSMANCADVRNAAGTQDWLSSRWARLRERRQHCARTGLRITRRRFGYVAHVSGAVITPFVRFDNLFDRKVVGAVIVNHSNAGYFESGPGRSV